MSEKVISGGRTNPDTNAEKPSSGRRAEVGNLAPATGQGRGVTKPVTAAAPKKPEA